MKNKTMHRLAAALLLSTFSHQPTASFAQGTLTPPGVPAAGMKTLAQIEPRTAISSAPFTINAAGSYYLTTNLMVSSGNAITMATNGVTLDLNGFTIASTAASATGSGISINSGLRNLTIRNGFIQGGVTNNGSGTYSGSGFQYGIFYSGIAPVNTRVTAISVAGCLVGGINLGSGDATVVDSCTVRTMGGDGIRASTIKSSLAVDCGSFAIYGDQVSDSRGEASGGGGGIYGITVQNCYGSCNNNGNGISANTALNCTSYSASGYGLSAITALNCSGSCGSGSYGLTATTAQNCSGTASGIGSFGIYANTAQNCSGTSNTGTGLYASDLAIGCRGTSTSGTGLSAYIANSCRGTSTTGTAQSITYKYNMP